MQKDNRYSVLIWLLIGALVLSTGFNFYLVTAPSKSLLLTSMIEEESDDENSPLAEELRLTRTMLARCQADHFRTDSLKTQAQNSRPPTMEQDMLASSK